MRRSTPPGRPLVYDPQRVSEECVSLEEVEGLLAIEAEPPGRAAGDEAPSDGGGWEVLDERGSMRVERWLPSSSEGDELLILRGTLELRDVPVGVALDQLHSLSARRLWDDHVAQLRRVGGAGSRRARARDGLESEIIQTETRPLFGVLPALKLTQWRALAWFGGAAAVLYRDASWADAAAGGEDAADGGGLADAWGAWLSELAAAACEPIRAKTLVIGQVIRRLDPSSDADGSRVFVYLQASISATAWLLAQGVAVDLISASCDAYEAACRAKARGPRPLRRSAEHRGSRTMPDSGEEEASGSCARGPCAARGAPPPQYFDMASHRGSVCSMSTTVSGAWWTASAPGAAAAGAPAPRLPARAAAGHADSPAEAAAGPLPAAQAEREQCELRMAEELDGKFGEDGKPWAATGGACREAPAGANCCADCVQSAGADGGGEPRAATGGACGEAPAGADGCADCVQSAGADGGGEPRAAAGGACREAPAGADGRADCAPSAGADGEPGEDGEPRAAAGGGAGQEEAPAGADDRADCAQSTGAQSTGTEDSAAARDFLGGFASAGGGLLSGPLRTPRRRDTARPGTSRAAEPPLGRGPQAAPRRHTAPVHGVVRRATLEELEHARGLHPASPSSAATGLAGQRQHPRGADEEPEALATLARGLLWFAREPDHAALEAVPEDAAPGPAREARRAPEAAAAGRRERAASSTSPPPSAASAATPTSTSTWPFFSGAAAGPEAPPAPAAAARRPRGGGQAAGAAAASPRENPLALAVAVRRRAGRASATPLEGALRGASGSLGPEAAARAREQLLLEDAWLQGEDRSPQELLAARGGRARRRTRGGREAPEPPIPVDALLTCCMPGAGAGIDVLGSARSPTASTAASRPP